MPIDTDLMLFHSFQERRLGLGGRAVNFIGQKKIGEDRSRAELELALTVVPHQRTRDIGGHKIWGELDTRHGQIDASSEGANQECLCNAGDAFKQDVSIGNQSDDQAGECAFLADDCLANF